MGSTASSHGETDAWLKEGRYVTAYERGEGPVRAEGVLQVVHRLMIDVSLGRLVSEIGLDYRHGCFLKKTLHVTGIIIYRRLRK